MNRYAGKDTRAAELSPFFDVLISVKGLISLISEMDDSSEIKRVPSPERLRSLFLQQFDLKELEPFESNIGAIIAKERKFLSVQSSVTVPTVE